MSDRTKRKEEADFYRSSWQALESIYDPNSGSSRELDGSSRVTTQELFGRRTGGIPDSEVRPDRPTRLVRLEVSLSPSIQFYNTLQ